MKRTIFLIGMLALTSSTASAVCVDHAMFDKILKANVNKEGAVDYDAIKINRGGDLYEYIAIIEDISVRPCTEPERIAFWVNAYNAHLIRLIMARPQLQNISDDPAMFDERFKLARMDLTLNMIFHRILRADPAKGGAVTGLSPPQFDPRLHFTISHGAVDSPRLLNRAYQPQAMEASLQANALAFANNPKHLRIENGILVVSTLLKDYAADFEIIGGAAPYLISLTDTALRKDAKQVDEALKNDFPDQTEFRFDWTLNSIKNKPVAP